jgi:hypothetical protein
MVIKCGKNIEANQHKGESTAAEQQSRNTLQTNQDHSMHELVQAPPG